MRKIYFYFVLVASVFLALISCVRDVLDDADANKNSEVHLTVDEARQFFENQIAGLATRSDDMSQDVSDRIDKRSVTPGEFTPLWEKAKTSSARNVASVDVPMLAEFRYKAVLADKQYGKVVAYSVVVSQKMIVVKDVETGNLASYILTLIPSRKFAASHKNDTAIADKFINCGDKGGFSGLAIYCRLSDSSPVRVDAYEDGKKKHGIGLFDTSREKREKNIAVMKRILSAVHFQRLTNIMATRGWDENDDGSYDGGDLDEIIVDIDDPWDYPDPDPDPWGVDDWGDVCTGCGMEPCYCEDNWYDDYPPDEDDDVANPADIFNADRRVKAVAEKLLSKLSANNAFVKLVNTINLREPNFLKIMECDTISTEARLETSYLETKGNIIVGMTIYLNDSRLALLNEDGVTAVILHEFGHALIYEKLDMIYDNRDHLAHHLDLLTDRDYIAAVMEIFPGHEPDWYRLYGYTQELPLNKDGSSPIENLPDSDKRVVIEIYNKLHQL